MNWPETGAERVWPWCLIAVCQVMLWVHLLALSAHGGLNDEWLRIFGFVPAAAYLVLSQPLGEWFSPVIGRLFSSWLIHGDWLHLLGNLAYLWVFGETVERALGHIRFLALFLLLGGLANLIAVWQMADTAVPLIGASSAVSAIIGVYLGLFPRRRIGVWLPLGLYLQFVRVPALIVIGSWFAVQLLYSLFGPTFGAVAWPSHVTGFALGLVVSLALRLGQGRVNWALREL